MIALRNKTIVLFNRLTMQMAASLLRKTVEIQKFCYYGNVTSHFSSLFFKLITCLLKMVNHVIISRNCTWVVSSHRHPQPRPRAGLKPRGRNCLVPVKRRTQLPDEYCSFNLALFQKITLVLNLIFLLLYRNYHHRDGKR